MCAVALFLALCVTTDLSSRRIPNALTLTGMIVGLALGGLLHGLGGVAASAGGLVLAIVLLIVPFALGGIGGGDV